MRNNDLAFLQELVSHANAFIEQAPGIAAKIKNQAFEIAELLQSVFHFLLSGLVKGSDVHVADAGLDEELQVHAVAGYFIAHHIELQRLGRGLPQDGDVDVGSARAFEHVCYVAHAEIFRRFAVNRQNHVAGTEAHFVSRSADERRYYDDLVIAGSNLHAHAVVFAALLFTQQGIGSGIKEIRVRIQYVQHPGNGAVVDGLIRVDRLGVILLYQRVNLRELPQIIAHVRV